MNKSDLIEKLKEGKQHKVQFAVADIDGVLRTKLISTDKFAEVADKHAGFCDVIFAWDVKDKCYDNTELTGWHLGYPDRKVSIDLDTLRYVPWNNKQPYFLADMEGDEQLADACPRTLLKRIASQAQEMGYQPMFSQEFEWFNFLGTPNDLNDADYRNLKPITPSMFGYSQLRPSLYQDYYNHLFDWLLEFDIPLEALHTETGPGVYEAAIRYDSVLRAADKATLFKTAVKEIAYQHQMVASFMAKWNANLPGCGGHLHQSLWNKEGTDNLFAIEQSGKENQLMQHYIAGVLHCLPHLLPMYAPTINSYKRLHTGDWAPNSVSWGVDNRTAALRALPSKTQSSRIELRVPGADANPYLAMAASLASGLYGIKHQLQLDSPATSGNAYADKKQSILATNLRSASVAMSNSELAKEILGEGFVNHFCKTRLWECTEHEQAVTDWELKRYFEII